MDINYFEAKIPFTQAFKHGSATRNETESIIVVITDGNGTSGYGEGCPRSYVTGESIQSCSQFYKKYHKDFLIISTFHDLTEFVSNTVDAIDKNPAAWCAVELAMLDLLAKKQNSPVETLFNVGKPKPFYQYSAIIGDSDPESFNALYKKYRTLGFTDFKVKLSADLQKEKAKLSLLASDLDHITVRGDANNLWSTKEEAIKYINELPFLLCSVEEPITSNQHEELLDIGEILGIKVVLDESFLRYEQIDLIKDTPSIWIVNVRVSKMGGIIRSLKIIETLATYGINITIGAQVGETSLLTRAALILADAAGQNLVAQEGAFGTLLLEKDIFEPTLQFGYGGKHNDATGYRQTAGFGLDFKSGKELSVLKF